jgi:hypothetical protein
MGIATIPSRVKLFMAVLFDAEDCYNDVMTKLSERFGPIDNSYGPIPFRFTDYYKDEMSGNQKKAYLTFEPLILREDLPAIKTFTNDIERQTAAAGKRTINLDPGYIAADKLVLASTKDFYHRIHLSQGIFAEVTLHYRKGLYRYFSWTFPDYKEPAFLEFLEKARAGYMKEIRG